MALINTKILEMERNAVYVKSVSSERLSGTVQQNKDVFDKFPQLIMDKYNALVDLLISIGLDNLETDLDDRYTKTETDNAIVEATNDLVESITINANTGVITVTKKDGTSASTDTPMEKIPAKYEFVEEEGKYYLRATSLDGTTLQVEITDFATKVVPSAAGNLALLTEDGNLSDSGKTINDLDSVFIATYGATPVADILEAYKAGKLVVAKNSRGALALISYPMIYGNRCYFTYVDMSNKKTEYWCCTETSWYTDNSIPWAFRPSLSTVTLPASGWSESDDGYEQTVTASAVSTSGYVYTVYPNSEQYKAWCEAGIYAEDVTESNKLTFKCDTVPTVDIVVNIKREAV